VYVSWGSGTRIEATTRLGYASRSNADLGHPTWSWRSECRAMDRASGSRGFQAVVFLDTVQMNAAPATLFSWRAPDRRAVPAAVHAQAVVGTLAALIEVEGRRVSSFLRAAPILDYGAELSVPVRMTLEILRDLLAESLPTRAEPDRLWGATMTAEPS